MDFLRHTRTFAAKQQGVARTEGKIVQRNGSLSGQQNQTPILPLWCQLKIRPRIMSLYLRNFSIVHRRAS